MLHPLTNGRWQKIITNQSGNFFYGVKTTKIFCKPTCHSKTPNKDNVLIFKTTREAIKSGFRPCKRCQPTGQTLSNDEWVNQIKKYLQLNYQQKLTLDKIALDCHGSSSSLQRIFKKVTNKSPNDYLIELRLQHSQQLLRETDYSIKTIATRCGFNSDTYFNTSFKTKYHQTPLDYKYHNN